MMNSIQHLKESVPKYSLFASGPRILALDIILPNKTVRHEEFQRSCEMLKIDSFNTYKYLYIMLDSDLDVFETIITQRVEILIFLWRKFYDSPWPRDQEAELSVGKSLLHHTLQVWFSCEWSMCPLKFRISLLNEFRKNLCILPLAEGIDFDAVVGLGITPWNVSYLHEIMELYTEVQVNTVIPEATSSDILFLIREGLPLIFNRLIKLFDCRKMKACINLCLRTLAAWNSQVYQKSRHLITITAITEASCLLHISHIYLMIIYEADDRKGHAIDKIMNEVRFFINGFQHFRPSIDEYIDELATYTASNYIALTVYQLNMTTRDFYVEYAMQNAAEETPTFYAVLLQSYLSYLLANWLLDYSMNTWELNPDMPYFIQVFQIYIETRQRSELFLQAEQRKQQRQMQSHNLGKIIKFITNFKEQINKGNLCENIILHDFHSISDEVIFEHLPQHEQLHLHIYNLLIDRPHNGWYLANVVLILKIISQLLNEIEIYRYQPGLTTDFMLSLDIQLSKYFENLAVIFENAYIFAQECWLTAFYLNPTVEYYRQVQRCGQRLLRSAKSEKLPKHLSPARIKHMEQLHMLKVTKYQLVSSTIDVYEIVKYTNNLAMSEDYTQLQNTLYKLDLPAACVKDLLTVCFAARSRYFAWVVSWPELQKRCKVFLNNSQQKRRFVEQSMAEANDRLQFLHIDYAKYKHRPMLDYGCIESGYEQDYEQLVTTVVQDYDTEVDDSENSDEDYANGTSFRKRVKIEQQQERERNDKLLLELDDSCFKGGRRTRARAASALRDKQEQKFDANVSNNEKTVEINISKVENIPMDHESQPTGDLKNLLSQRRAFMNNTEEFTAIRDIWNYSQHDVANVDLTTIAIHELKSSLVYFAGCTRLFASVENNGEKSSINNRQDEKMVVESDIDSFSENNSLDNYSLNEYAPVKFLSKMKEASSEFAKKTNGSDDNSNHNKMFTNVIASSTEIDLQEENDAMEVNLQIYFNKQMDCDESFESIALTYSPDSNFSNDVNKIMDLENDITQTKDDECLSNDEFTLPIELFEDVPTNLKIDVDMKSNGEHFINLVQQLRNIIQEVDEKVANAYTLKQKLKYIIQYISDYGAEVQHSSDDDDDFEMNDKEGNINVQKENEVEDKDCDSEDYSDDKEEGNKFDVEIDKNYESKKTNNHDVNLKDLKKKIELELRKVKHNHPQFYEIKNNIALRTKKCEYDNNKTLGNIADRYVETLFESNMVANQKPNEGYSYVEYNITSNYTPASNVKPTLSKLKHSILEIIKNEISFVENNNSDRDKTFIDDGLFANPKKVTQPEIHESNRVDRIDINDEENHGESDIYTSLVDTLNLDNASDKNIILQSVKNYIHELVLKKSSLQNGNILSITEFELGYNDFNESENIAEMGDDSSFEIITMKSEIPNSDRSKTSTKSEKESFSAINENSVRNIKRSAPSDSNEEFVLIKKSVSSGQKYEKRNVVSDDVSQHQLAKCLKADIDCTSALWQPTVRLKRLQVVKGHVIRDVRVCVRRLKNFIQRNSKKKAVRFAPSSMVYEYIEDDESVFQRIELLKDYSSSNEKNLEGLPVIRLIKGNFDDYDGGDDDEEYDDADDTEYSPKNDYIQPVMPKRRSRRKIQKRSSAQSYSSITSYDITDTVVLDTDEESTILEDSENSTEYIDLSSFEEELVLGN